MHLSIVVPVYQAESFLDEFHARATHAARAAGGDYEIIYVNDGSTDGSLAKLVAFHAQDAHVVVIDFSKNFGLHPAMRAGFARAKGERIFFIASDLEESPEWLALLAGEMEKTGADIVYTREPRRSGNTFYRVSGNAFYACVRLFACRDIVHGVLNARLLSRRCLDAMLLFTERHIALDVMCHMTGFAASVVTVEKAPSRKSTFTLRKRLGVAFDYLTGLTSWPLALPYALALAAVLCPLFYYLTPVAILLSLGILGSYLATLLDEVRARPLYIVKQVYETVNP